MFSAVARVIKVVVGGGEGTRERQRRNRLGGSGGMLPQKILKSRGLEMLFAAFCKSYF